MYLVAGEAPYWVIDTDYKKYSIVWSCSGFGFMSFSNAYFIKLHNILACLFFIVYFAGIVWYLARERQPSEEITRKVYAKLKQLQIPTDPLQKTMQEGCTS